MVTYNYKCKLNKTGMQYGWVCTVVLDADSDGRHMTICHGVKTLSLKVTGEKLQLVM